MLQGANPVGAIVIAVFEFMFYWCIMLSVASLLRHGWESSRNLIRGRAKGL
jgi:Na+/serine symporter